MFGNNSENNNSQVVLALSGTRTWKHSNFSAAVLLFVSGSFGTYKAITGGLWGWAEGHGVSALSRMLALRGTIASTSHRAYDSIKF